MLEMEDRKKKNPNGIRDEKYEFEMDMHWVGLTCRSDGAEEKIGKLENKATKAI